MQPGGGDGTLSFAVWPTYAGAVNDRGEEPMGDRDYERGPITWELNEQGRLVGRAAVRVPSGTREWTHVIYTHNPTTPGFVAAQKLGHPLRLPSGGTIDMIDITDEDVLILNPEKVLHD